MLRILIVCAASVVLLGCGDRSPSQLQAEVNRLRREKADAEAHQEAAEKKLADYRMDLEHQRYLVAQLKQKNEELQRQIEQLQQADKLGDIVARIEASQLDRQLLRPPARKPQPPASPSSSRTRPSEKPRPVAGATEQVKQAATPKPAASRKPSEKPESTVRKREESAASSPRKPATKPAPSSKPKEKAALPASVAEEEQESPPKPVPPAQLQFRTTTPTSSTKKELQLVDVAEVFGGGKLRITGTVANNTDDPVVETTVTALFYGSGGETIQELRVSPASGGSVAPHSGTPFAIELPYDERIRGYKLNVFGTQRTGSGSNEG